MRKQPEVTDATRNILLDAFWSIYQQKPVNQITVKAVVDAAYVHRSTFYRYFTDIYDLLNQFERKIIFEISSNLDKNIRTNDFTDLIAHADVMMMALKEYAPMIYRLTGQHGDAHFRTRLRAQMEAHLSALNIWALSPLSREYILHFMFSCILSNLSFWYEHRDTCSLEEICTISQQIVLNGIPHYIRNAMC